MQKAKGKRQNQLARWLFFCLLPSAFCLVGASEASADIVVFKTGRTMSAKTVRIEGEQATLQLREGGEVSFNASLIARVDPDEVAYPEPKAEEVAAPITPVQSVAKVFSGPSDEVLAKRPYANLISSAAKSQGVDVRLVHAVIEVESNYEARARSKKGARGLMQLMPDTARQYGVRNSYDPKSNIEAGVRYLKDLLGRLELPMALAAYNAGEGTVQRYGGLPPFAETQSYVARILQKVGR